MFGDKMDGSTLEGLVVVEMASVLAGPSVGQFLAELGARVIKIEHPDGGDVTRSWRAPGQPEGTTSAYFASCNYGKESVALDLRAPAARALLLRLIARADIATMSFRKGSAERMGIGATQLLDHNPRLIVGRISGYGYASDRPGYDAVVQAESGFMSINGTPDSGPTKMPVALMDLLAAHQLKEGILVALIGRASTGRGSIVDVSLIEAAVASLANQATNYLATGDVPRPMGSAHPNIAPYGSVFFAEDGKPFVLAVGTDNQFASLCSILGVGALARDVRFTTNAVRVVNRRALEVEIQDAARSWNRAELLSRFVAAGVPAGAVQNLDSVFETDLARGMLLGECDAHLPCAPGIRQIAFAGPPRRNLGSPPTLGQDTTRVLQEYCGAATRDLQAIGWTSRDQ